jgi:uncharacterized protein (UPF0333 family)
MVIGAMGRGKRGQVALEYLLIFSLSVALTIPLIILFVTQSAYLEADISESQVDKIAFELEQAAKEVYFLGEPSQKTVELVFPRGIQEVTVEPSALIFNVSLAGKYYAIFYDFPMNITGYIRPTAGLHVIAVQATTTGVSFTER